jgi:hypothetical protein
MLAYTAYDQAGNSYLGNITHKGARPWMVLTPVTLPANPTGAQTLTLTSTGAGDYGSATLAFQPGYL